MAIIGQCTSCIIQDLNPTPCNVAHTLFSANGLKTEFTQVTKQL